MELKFIWLFWVLCLYPFWDHWEKEHLQQALWLQVPNHVTIFNQSDVRSDLLNQQSQNQLIFVDDIDSLNRSFKEISGVILRYAHFQTLWLAVQIFKPIRMLKNHHSIDLCCKILDTIGLWFWKGLSVRKGWTHIY